MGVHDRLFDKTIDELDAVNAAEHVAVPVLDEVALEEGLYRLVWWTESGLFFCFSRNDNN